MSQMGCLELFIFENGQPMTTPPPKVYFWAFRLTVYCQHTKPIVNTPFSTTPVFSTPDENNDRGNHDTSPSLIGIADITSPLPTDGQI